MGSGAKVREPFRYISYGAGVQSTALLVMSALQLDGYPCPKANLAIFANTGDEPRWVYHTLAYYKEHFGHKIPIVVVGRPKSLSLSMRDAALCGVRSVTIPAFTAGEDGRPAILQRQCTREFKIEVIQAKVVKEIKRLHYARCATAMLGISLDEAMRMKPSGTKWITNTWPLIDARMTRGDCVRFLESLGLPVPRKSSCVFCPFHADKYWIELRKNYPDEFERACEFDRAVRNMTKRGINGQVFVHRSLVPLSDVKFRHENQMDFFENECEGHCGV